MIQEKSLVGALGQAKDHWYLVLQGHGRCQDVSALTQHTEIGMLCQLQNNVELKVELAPLLYRVKQNWMSYASMYTGLLY